MFYLFINERELGFEGFFPPGFKVLIYTLCLHQALFCILLLLHFIILYYYINIIKLYYRCVCCFVFVIVLLLLSLILWRRNLSYSYTKKMLNRCLNVDNCKCTADFCCVCVCAYVVVWIFREVWGKWCEHTHKLCE